MRNIGTIALSATALLAISVGLAPTAAADRALLVSVDRQLDPAFSHASLGQPVVNDAEAMRTLLVERYGVPAANIVVLRGSDSTKARIMGELDAMVTASRPGEQLYFFYSGHGLQVADTNADEDDGLDEAIVPADARVTVMAGTSDAPRFNLIGDMATRAGAREARIDNLILDDEIAAWLARAGDRRVTTWFDSCNSGTVHKSAGVTPAAGLTKTLFSFGVQPSRTASRSARRGATRVQFVELPWVETSAEPTPTLATEATHWSAAAANQLAFVDPARNMSVFTRAFVQAVNAAPGVTNSKALQVVREESSEFCRRNAACVEANGGELTPLLDGTDTYMARPVVAGSFSGRPNVLEVLAPSSQFDVSVEMSPLNPTVGTAVRFRVRSPRAGRLTLLDVDDSGTLYRLFPNERSEELGVSSLLPAGAALNIPSADYGFELTMTEATRGTVIAIVSVEGADINAILEGRRSKSASQLFIDLPTPEEGAAAINDVAEALHRPILADEVAVTADDPTSALTSAVYGFGYVTYSVRP